jgi:hypothetical protein
MSRNGIDIPRTSSAACSAARAGWPSAKRTSKATVRPSTQPRAFNPARSASGRGCGADPSISTPTLRSRSGAWARVPRDARTAADARRARRFIRLPSFHDLVGAGKQRWRKRQAELSRRRHVYDETVFGGSLRRQIGGLGAAQHAVDIVCRPIESVERIGPIGHQPAIERQLAMDVHGRQPKALDTRHISRPCTTLKGSAPTMTLA